MANNNTTSFRPLKIKKTLLLKVNYFLLSYLAMQYRLNLA